MLAARFDNLREGGKDAMREAVRMIPGTDLAVGFERPVRVAILGNDAEGPAKVATEFAEKVKRFRAWSMSSSPSSPVCRLTR